MPEALPVTAADVDDAADRIESVVRRTPLQRNARLSAQYGLDVYLKREDLQVVRSYKIRGAYNLIAQLDASERAAGVTCASAGNHAQGVALSCRSLGITGQIFLPRNTPRQKRDRIRVLGGAYVSLNLVGNTYDQAATAATEYAQDTGATLVPPFDDARTVAGQGTVAKEIAAQMVRQPDYVVVPVGGGGLIAGMAAWSSTRLSGTKLVGVEPAGAPSMQAAIAAGTPVLVSDIDPFVDGAAVGQVGAVPFEIISSLAIGASSVPEGAICSHMLAMYQNEGIITEPAGALSVAALDYLELDEGSTVVCIISGGNNDVSRYSEILERSLVHEGLKHYFLVNFSQEPGALRQLLDTVLGPEDDITLFEYVKRNNREVGPALVGIELGAAETFDAFMERARAAPFEIERLEPGSPAYSYLT